MKKTERLPISILIMLSLMFNMQAAEQKKVADATVELMKAVEENDLSHAKKALANGARIDVRNSHKDTPLHLASENKNDSSLLVTLLLDNKADIDARDKNGHTPLMVAKNEGALRVLLNRGANINALNERGETPAIMAARVGQIWKLKFLVNQGADISIADNEGNTIFTTKVSLRFTRDNIIKQQELDQYLRELKKEIKDTRKAVFKPQICSATCEELAKLSEEQKKEALILPEQRALRGLISDYVLGEMTPEERAALQTEMEQETMPSAPGGPQ